MQFARLCARLSGRILFKVRVVCVCLYLQDVFRRVFPLYFDMLLCFIGAHTHTHISQRAKPISINNYRHFSTFRGLPSKAPRLPILPKAPSLLTYPNSSRLLCSAAQSLNDYASTVKQCDDMKMNLYPAAQVSRLPNGLRYVLCVCERKRERDYVCVNGLRLSGVCEYLCV